MKFLSRWLLAAVLLAALLSACIHWLDVPLATHVREVPATYRSISNLVTELGKPEWYLVPLGIFGFIHLFRRGEIHRQLWLAFAQIGLAGLTATLLKVFFGRCRPKMLFSSDEVHYGFTFLAASHDHTSFPSGHSAVAFAVAVALSRWQPRGPIWWMALVAVGPIIGTAHHLHTKLTHSHRPHDIVADLISGLILAGVFALLAQCTTNTRKPAATAILFAFALLIALSRIIVEAHYLSDVIAGAVVGSLVAHALQRLAEDHNWIDHTGATPAREPARAAVTATNNAPAHTTAAV